MEIASQIIATVLGCGSSGGVPRIGSQWGACDPKEPRNRRRRCSLLLTGTTPGLPGRTRVLIDTGCDLREQLLDANVKHLDAVLYSHQHADHTHGIDDLRVLAMAGRQRVNVFFSPEAEPRIMAAFGYCFTQPTTSPYPPILNAGRINAGQTLRVEGPGGAMNIKIFAQVHGDIGSLGFRVGGLAYSCDVSDLPDPSVTALEGLDTWIVDALRYDYHPSHFALSDALDWIARIKPKKAYLTNMHIDLDYHTVGNETPDNVVPAHDGLEIDITP
jgi:phosphoribosyl 1,2-cyclic phosphate phosphodiesterase